MDEEERYNEQECSEMEAEFHFLNISQCERDLPPHKQTGYAERMAERSDELRQLSKEMMQ